MIRKKRVSFKDDLVERIPNSFSQGLEVNEEVFVTDFTQVFMYFNSYWVQVEWLVYTLEFVNIRFWHPREVFFEVISFCLPNFLFTFQTFVGAFLKSNDATN